MVMRNQAEVLKCRFGSAISDPSMDNQIVSIPGVRGRDAKEISVRNLANVIHENLDRRGQIARLQMHDADGPAPGWEVHRQYLECFSIQSEPQYGTGQR